MLMQVNIGTGQLINGLLIRQFIYLRLVLGGALPASCMNLFFLFSCCRATLTFMRVYVCQMKEA